MQIRSLIQHSWATRFEIAGTFRGEALKSGQGSPEWLRFFELASILFSQLENPKLKAINGEENKNLKQETIDITKKLSVFEILRAFSMTTKYGDQYNKPEYFLLTLNVDEQNTLIEYYAEEDSNDATEKYLNLEKRYENTNINIVLVAAELIWSLKKAYPNYFAGSKFFLETLDKVLSN